MMTVLTTAAKNNAALSESSKDEDMERCVICGRITDVPVSLIISKRKTYLPTAGHLCDACCKRYCGVEDLRVVPWLWDEFL